MASKTFRPRWTAGLAPWHGTGRGRDPGFVSGDGAMAFAEILRDPILFTVPISRRWNRASLRRSQLVWRFCRSSAATESEPANRFEYPPGVALAPSHCRSGAPDFELGPVVPRHMVNPPMAEDVIWTRNSRLIIHSPWRRRAGRRSAEERDFRRGVRDGATVSAIFLVLAACGCSGFERPRGLVQPAWEAIMRHRLTPSSLSPRWRDGSSAERA